MLKKPHQIEPARPDNASLDTRSSLQFPSGGMNKSVWQTFIDASGFANRHPELVQDVNLGKTK